MNRLSGAIAATPTPFSAAGDVDMALLLDHCRWLLDSGCRGINLLGTTGEATSLPVADRLRVMESVAASGLPMERFMVGTGAASLGDAIELTRRSVELRFSGSLVLPPFYFKGVDDDGLFAYFDRLVRATRSDRLRLYLYNFPQNTGIRFSPELVRRLAQAFGDRLAGMKDSSGDMDYASLIATSMPGLGIFPSAEAALAKVAPAGDAFAGVISATLNVTAPFAGRAAAGEAALAEIDKAVKVRAALSSVPLVAAVKWALADLTGQAGWNAALPPLRALTADEVGLLQERLSDTAYAELKRSV